MNVIPPRVAAELGLLKASADATRSSSSRDAFDRYVLALRRGGWSLAEISSPLHIGRETVRRAAVRAEQVLDQATDLPDVPASPPKRRRRRAAPTDDEVTPDEVSRLQYLAPLAASVRGFTPMESPARRASAEFTELLARIHGRGVPLAVIERATGIARSTIQLRLARWGRISTPPSVAKYQGVQAQQPRREICAHGHPLTAANTYIRRRSNGTTYRICRTCHQHRMAAYRARKRANSDNGDELGELTEPRVA